MSDAIANESFCYLTTAGRVSGKPHEIEIWFGMERGVLYLLSGGRDRSDWVRNLRKTPEVLVRIGGRTFRGHARLVTKKDEDALARKLLLEKYAPGYGGDLTGWGKTALPVAIDLDLE
jgi:deazaflavin-dependent oxidoreductase (nitroreductase family)